MKILQINKFFYRRGGAESVFFDTSELLRSRGNDVMFFSMDHAENIESPYSKYFVSNVDYTSSRLFRGNVIKKFGRTFYSWESRRQLSALLDEERPDVCHAHNIYQHISPSILDVLRQYHIPVVMSLHDYKLVSPNYVLFHEGGARCEHAKQGFVSTVLHRCVRGSFFASAAASLEHCIHRKLNIYEKNVSRFIVPSRYMETTLKDFGFTGDMEVLSHFIKTRPKYTKKKIPYPPYLFYFGRLSSEKGVDLLIEMMYHARFPVPLLIGGEGPQQEDLEDKVREYGLHKKVIFLGRLDESQRENFLDHCLCVLIPSRSPETFSLASVEAMRAGKAIIAANSGALAERVSEGLNGYLFEPGNVDDLSSKVEFMLSHPDVMKQMGMAGQALASREYSPEQHYDRLMEVYEESIKKMSKSYE